MNRLGAAMAATVIAGLLLPAAHAGAAAAPASPTAGVAENVLARLGQLAAEARTAGPPPGPIDRSLGSAATEDRAFLAALPPAVRAWLKSPRPDSRASRALAALLERACPADFASASGEQDAIDRLRATLAAPPPGRAPAVRGVPSAPGGPPLEPDQVLEQLHRLGEAARADLDELAELDRADADIERLRKTDVELRLLDRDGTPLALSALKVNQVASDFRFGGNLYLLGKARTPADNAAYEKAFAQLFNYATTDIYWQGYEPVDGRPDYAHTERVLAWCEARGIRVKGHPLLWSHPSAVPRWSKGLPSPERQQARVLELVSQFRGRIASWDVVNEPAHTRQPVDQPHEWARQADPAAELVVNDFQVLADGYPAFRSLLERMLDCGIPFDAVGIQAHYPLHLRFPLAGVRAVLDRYAQLGKPLHITEFTPCSAGQPILGSHRVGVWSEEEQALYAERFYRLAFSHPAVEAITWWDLSDQGAWQKGGGLLRADMSPKPAYRALARLIGERWRTRLATTTDAGGIARFRGFHGRYEVRVGERRQTFDLAPGGSRRVEVRLD